METTRDDPDESSPPVRREHCAEITLADGGIVIYDTNNHSAWIQSSETVSLEDAE